MIETIELLRKPTGPDRTDLDDVLSDETLTKAEKRAILASWVSDQHAVENAPSLRRLDTGAIICVDDVLHALQSLDGSFDSDADRILPPAPFSRRRRARVSAWLRRAMRNRSDDDDPPPCPAAVAAAPRRVFTDAWQARPQAGGIAVTSAAAM